MHRAFRLTCLTKSERVEDARLKAPSDSKMSANIAGIVQTGEIVEVNLLSMCVTVDAASFRPHKTRNLLLRTQSHYLSEALLFRQVVHTCCWQLPSVPGLMLSAWQRAKAKGVIDMQGARPGPAPALASAT